jgi:two-component system, NtrC family, sensor kinase
MIILVLEQLRFVHERRSQWQLRTREHEEHLLRIKVTSTEERYRILFEVASEAIIITATADLKILELNRAAERILGLSQSEALGQSLATFCTATNAAGTPPQPGEDWFNLVSRERFQTVTRKDGNSLPVELDGSKVDYAGLPAYQFFLREITERGRLEQQLRQAEKLSALGQMISGVAHELNNPLAVIKGFVELVLNHHDINPRTRANLEKAAQETNRAARLVRNLLSMSRQQPERREVADLNEMLTRIVELRKLDFAVAEIDYRLNLEPDLPPLSLNSDQIQQVIIILINNALQALVGLHRPGRLHFRTQHLPERVRLTVEDSGPGVPPHLRAKIFAPFFTTKPAGVGTGLGLSIAHGILTEHRGRIFYEASALGGAGFVIELPVDPNSRLENVPSATAIPSAQHEMPLARRVAKVLVLDDEPSLAELLVEMVKLLGHESILCPNGQRGLELIAQNPFDLVFSDYHMPSMNGRQFYEAATQQRPEMKNRFVFLTGDVLTKDVQTFLDSLGNPCLSKPFSLDQVQNIIKEMYLDKLPSD